VVGQYNAPISYNRGTNTCILTCHQVAHNANGSVTKVSAQGLKGMKLPK